MSTTSRPTTTTTGIRPAMPPCASLASCSGRSARRPLDIAARLGGEEFAVLLYDSEEGNTPAIAERLRQAVEALGIEHLAPAPAPA
ncbi:diguanylate cyclase [Pseudomonas aeruginosa]|nr:diguanylate cyclase [Pseudomonas aeruginosa]